MQTPPALSPANRPLYRWERAFVFAAFALVVAFGWVTLKRSAFLTNRMTDYGVYARAAWTVRTGGDLYRSTDDNGWHYVYPPPFVLLFLPLADPPADADRAGYLPYPIGVLIWYAVSVLLLAYSVHTFAAACLPDAVRWSRRWWYARLLPFDFCIGGIGYTLARGQANILLVAMIAAGFAAAVRSRPIRSGAWFAAAACLKVFPGLLVLFPVARREWRAAIGYGVAPVVLLLVLPSLVWGPAGAIRENKRFLQLVVAPGLFDAETLSDEDKLLAAELHNMTAKVSQSFVATLHYWRYPDPNTRPDTPDPDARLWHAILSLAMVSVTLATVVRRGSLTLNAGAASVELPAVVRRRSASPADWLVFLGCLVAVMLLAVPVSHFHYYAITLPFAAGLVCRSLAYHPGRAVPDPLTLAVLIAWAAATSLLLFDEPPFERLRTAGVAPVATLLLWGYGVGLLWRGRPSRLPA